MTINHHGAWGARRYSSLFNFHLFFIIPARAFSPIFRLAFRWDELGQEIMKIAVPGALALMADPVASLVDTAFIGHIGLLLLLPSLRFQVSASRTLVLNLLHLDSRKNKI